jgi:hypothetical protein
MSKIKLRRSLYIGLGGTGMNALLHTKKMFMETYGEIPPMIGFLGIDTDGKVYQNELDSKIGKIRLDPNEQKPISVTNPAKYYSTQKKDLAWLPNENSSAIRTLDQGAGQVRTNGRLGIFYNAPTVIQSINASISGIRNFGSITSEKYELDTNSTKDDIHIVFSLCGGTGCGTFIDVAYLIQGFAGAETINVIGYAVLPDVFTEMVKGGNAMARVKPNAYGALKDLDYLMHLTPNSEKIDFKFPGKNFNTNEKPFSAVYLIDNKNEGLVTYNHINQLTEMIALTLFTSSGQIANKVGSVNDNVKISIAQGDMNIGNKSAWASSIGACEIVFNGSELANIYSHKAAVHIIDRLINGTCSDANAIANNWIDSPEINIRENNNNDNCINKFCNNTPKYPLGDVDVTGIETTIDTYYKTVVTSDNDLSAILTGINLKIKDSLQNMVVKEINQECGVTTSLAVLEDILRQVQIFTGEMNDEIKAIKEKMPILENAVKVGIENLKEWDKKGLLAIGKKKKMEEAKEDISTTAYQVAIATIEIKRRDYANRVFTALKNEIAEQYQKATNIKKTLEGVRTLLSQKINAIQNGIEKHNPVFEIDLSKNKEINITIETIIISEFIDVLPTRNLYDLGNAESTERSLLKFAKRLKETKAWEDTSIDAIINEYSEDTLQEIIRIATEKTKPLLRFNGQGHTVADGTALEQAINKYYFVGLPTDDKTGRFALKFKASVPAQTDVDFIATGRNDRIVLFRQEGVVPAFAINPLESYKYMYEQSPIRYHFDALLYEKMTDEGFDFMPQNHADDDIEYWVKGFIFGFIKREKDKYSYKDWRKGKALDNFWVSTSENKRDKAYDKFKRAIEGLRKQYMEKVDEAIATEGKAATKKLLEKVRSSYFTDYAQCEVNIDTIKKSGYEKVATLVEDELKFIENNLSEM